MRKKHIKGAYAFCLLAFLILLFGMARPALVQELASEQKPTADEAFVQFGGSNSVSATLKQDDKKKRALIQDDFLERALAPYFDFKKHLKKNYGFMFAFDYNALLQIATESLGNNTAATGVVRFYGKWDLIGRASGNTGSFTYKVENRHSLGTDTSPNELGSEIGYAGLTATTFGNTGWELTNLFWEQRLFDERFIIGGGVVDTTDYVNVYSMSSPWIDFNNQAFLNDPTIPTPSQGLGAAALVLVTRNLYVLGGFADTNGDPTDPWESVNTFFDQAEYFSHIELGWIDSFKNRYRDNIHITAWQGAPGRLRSDGYADQGRRVGTRRVLVLHPVGTRCRAHRRLQVRVA